VNGEQAIAQQHSKHTIQNSTGAQKISDVSSNLWTWIGCCAASTDAVLLAKSGKQIAFKIPFLSIS